MPDPPSKTERITQADFATSFISWGLRIAVFAGFALGAHVASVIGLDMSLGNWFYTYVQAHGHLQLAGWIGLFIIGISLHFIPRLAGVPIRNKYLLPVVLWLLVSGLGLRFLADSFLPYCKPETTRDMVNFAGFVSGVLEWLGVAIYLFLVLSTVRDTGGVGKRPALKSVRPFFFLMFTGWIIYASINCALLYAGWRNGALVLDQGWNELAIHVFIHLILVPVIFAFSIRLFPLYLRLPATNWPVFRFSLLYGLCALAFLAMRMPVFLTVGSRIPAIIATVALTTKGMLCFYFVWRLDLLTRRREPWTVDRIGEPAPTRRPTRTGIPDYGEFGKFEWLVYGSYIWLLVACGLEVAIGVSSLFNYPLGISTDVVRHCYVLGFASQLVLGMAPRMIPGFAGKKGVAKPGLVIMTFWLINVAAFSRIVPLFATEAFGESVISVLQFLFALSGMFGLAAVVVLWVNLKKTLVI